MKTADDILLLGNPRLNDVSAPIQEHELKDLKNWVNDLHTAMEDVRAKYGFGRGIAAPQLGIMKRLIYVNINKPIIIINPEIINKSDEMIELWDDCMSFPNLFVKVKRHKTIKFKYLDENWKEREWTVHDDLSELFQHEFDHLNGTLSTDRAVANQPFRWRKLKELK